MDFDFLDSFFLNVFRILHFAIMFREKFSKNFLARYLQP